MSRKEIEEALSDAFRGGDDVRFDEAVQAVADQWEESVKVTKDTSDGFHTFRELYMHRMALTLALAVELGNQNENNSWRSMCHHPDDGPMFEDSFIVGIELTPTKVFTYHYNIRFWNLFHDIQTLEHAPKWDGAGPSDTVDMLLAFYSMQAVIDG